MATESEMRLTDRRSASNFFIAGLAVFNVLFIFYILAISYYNRLSLDDYAYLGHMREKGFFSPFKYWYFNWQGRFAPQFLLNIVFDIYQLTSSLFFYTVLLGVFFIYAIDRLLEFFFEVRPWVRVNYSILIFSALLLTCFDISTFFWANASTMYFGGMLFLLLGVVFILTTRRTIWHHFIIAVCFVYAGSSSEHIGVLSSFVFFAICAYFFYKNHFDLKTFYSSSLNRALFTAFIFASLAFVIMIAAPGNKVRLGITHHVTAPVELMTKSLYSTMFVLGHTFYKLPYIIGYIPLFVLFGTFLPKNPFYFPIRYSWVLLLSSGAFFVFIFVGNLPLTYATGRPGPLRAYVYVNFAMIALLFIMGSYTGFLFRSHLTAIKSFSIIGLVILLSVIIYISVSEIPRVKQYSASDKERIDLLKKYQKQGRTAPVYLKPLHYSGYNTLSDMWRNVTHTENIPSALIDLPLIADEIADPPDWQNRHIQFGLDAKFDIYLDSVKSDVGNPGHQ